MYKYYMKMASVPSSTLLPSWLRVYYPSGENYWKTRKILFSRGLNTVCQSAICPNISECWNKQTVTFMILGDVCTRSCLFCGVNSGLPKEADLNEPKRIADAVSELGLKHAVVTCVTRDDLTDGGASVFVEVIEEISRKSPGTSIEVLISDFKGDMNALGKVVAAKPDVIGHNIDVVRNRFREVKGKGGYDLSLNILKKIKELDPSIKTKSGFMVGLGENIAEIMETIRDIKEAGVDFLTIGQYLQPTKKCLKVEKYYSPDEFNRFKEFSLQLGFSHVESGPLVRSSYHAADALKK